MNHQANRHAETWPQKDETWCQSAITRLHLFLPQMDQKDESDSDQRDPTYFSYYAQFVHQQNMLQDSIRTSMYQTAILSNSQTLFMNKTVMDLGAGSGFPILSRDSFVFCRSCWGPNGTGSGSE